MNYNILSITKAWPNEARQTEQAIENAVADPNFTKATTYILYSILSVSAAYKGKWNNFDRVRSCLEVEK